MSEVKRKSLVEFKRERDVDASAETVWNTILTPRTWVLCFPATVNVGGDSIWEPFKPGNMVIEKFMWGGFLYGVFTYKIGEYKPPFPYGDDAEAPHNPAVFLFAGKQVFTNTFLDLFFRKDIAKVHCDIRYTLNQKEVDGKVVTNWHRHSMYYHTGGLKTMLFFKTFIFIMRRSLKQQSEIYMDTAKELIESKTYEVGHGG